MAAILRSSSLLLSPQLWGAALCLGLLMPVGVRAQEPTGKQDGLVIRVPTPITEAFNLELKRTVQDEIRKGRKLQKIIFDFNADKNPSTTTSPWPCLELKAIIKELRGRQLTTVAYLQNKVSGYTVLPVLECDEIVMSSEATLGNVCSEKPLSLAPEGVKEALEAAAKRWRRSADVVRKLGDGDMQLVQVQLQDGVGFLDERTVEKAEREGKPYTKINDTEPVPTRDVLTSKQAKKYQLAQDSCESLEKLVARYGLLPHLSREVLMMGRTQVPFCIEIVGTLDDEQLGWLDRSLHDARRHGANLIVLYLNATGGETEKAYTSARKLALLRDQTEKPIRTIAYVPPESKLGAATYLALGCSEIVMSSKAVLGDFAYLKGDNKERFNARREALMDLAVSRGYQPEVFKVMLQPESLEGLDGKAAAELGVARYGDVEALNELYGKYDIDPQKVTVLKNDWFRTIAEFFRQPLVMALLVMVGIAGLILEFKMPGIGIPGIIAAICFVLFFWAHSFVGQYTILAIFLFILGLILLGLEIFVVPGFGVTGISGILLVVLSLALVTLEKIPATHSDWYDLGTKVLLFGGSLVGAFAGAMAIARFLPNIPYASRLVLMPPTDGDAAQTLAAPDAMAALLGAIGVAATTLRPAGKARFGDEYLDVIAENDYVNPGSRVQVIEIEGNRIVVKEV